MVIHKKEKISSKTKKEENNEYLEKNIYYIIHGLLIKLGLYSLSMYNLPESENSMFIHI